MLVYRHPKYYTEIRKRAKEQQKKLRERNKLDQVISHSASTEANSRRAPGPGHKPQASSSKPQAKPEPSSGS